MSSPFELVARSLRNGETEDWHYGAAAVVTPTGQLVGAVGQPQVPVFLRSVAKPVQALPLVLEGGCERFELTREDLAVICASHYGTEAHEVRVASILRRVECTEDDLQCGTHRPFDAAARRTLLAAGEPPRVLQNNCSGKHAGMLAACRLLGLSIEDYLDRDHPLQVRIRTELELLGALDDSALIEGVDGCSLPTYSLPLGSTARIYAALADPRGAGLDPARVDAVERIVEAMASAPEMVAGPGQFTTRLIETTGGRLLGKEGAQGYYAVAVRGPVALGLVAKIADGDQVCRPAVVLDLLRQVGALSAGEFGQLRDLYDVRLSNHRRLEVGAVVSEVELRNV